MVLIIIVIILLTAAVGTSTSHLTLGRARQLLALTSLLLQTTATIAATRLKHIDPTHRRAHHQRLKPAQLCADSARVRPMAKRQRANARTQHRPSSRQRRLIASRHSCLDSRVNRSHRSFPHRHLRGKHRRPERHQRRQPLALATAQLQPLLRGKALQQRTAILEHVGTHGAIVADKGAVEYDVDQLLEALDEARHWHAAVAARQRLDVAQLLLAARAILEKVAETIDKVGAANRRGGLPRVGHLDAARAIVGLLELTMILDHLGALATRQADGAKIRNAHQLQTRPHD